MEMNLPKFLILIALGFLVIAFSLSHYEQNNDPDSNINKFVQSLGGILILIVIIYFIIVNMDTGKIIMFGYKLERGLFIYVFIIFMLLFFM